MVSTASVEDLCRSTVSWLDQHCSLPALRPSESVTVYNCPFKADVKTCLYIIYTHSHCMLSTIHCPDFFFVFFFGKTFSFCPHSLCASSVVLSSLRLLSTTTAILTDPTLLPEQATLAVTQDDTTAGPVPDNSLQPTTWNSMPPMWRE